MSTGIFIYLITLILSIVTLRPSSYGELIIAHRAWLRLDLLDVLVLILALGLLHILEKLLCMTSDLRPGPCLNMLFYSFPFFAVKSKS